MTIDYDLKPEDIQTLSNRDTLVAFFAALHYNTETRISQSAANLGIGTESVVREIKHIEQIASQDGLFHIYLFELTSVTVALTNALVRSFRNKQGEYLLVLTNDYERLDFVLVERSIPLSAAGTSIGERNVLVKPRVLTIERRKPTRRQLRVLRRFTYTESDPFYQFDKLKSAYSIYDWSEEHFNNRILFADYYLQERLRDQPEWKEDVKPLYLRIREVMADASHLWNGKKESELREGVFEKLFVALGFTFHKEKESKDDSPKPDYLLFGKSSDIPIALCLCYPWGRSLDGKDDQRDQDTPEENPSAAVVSVLKDNKAPWAIVTNGKLWRLFNAKTSSVAASYYEIDLEEILAAPTQLASPSTFDLSESFKYFSLFFRREAFESRKEIVAGEERTTTFLDFILKGSEDYAKRLGERLKDRVFEEVFIHLAEGFVEYMKKRDGKDVDLNQEILDEVFQGTLTLLYRFLFLLYAESRDLFPVKEIRGYYEKSLTRLKQEIAEVGGTIEAEVGSNIKDRYSVSTTVLYDRLLELFNIVDQGDSSINVPMYNGGLFLSKPSPEDQSEDAELARFLLYSKVPDRYLALGLDLLARDEDDKTFKLVAIDYKSLGVRQLGSIYEGLLEFKLHIAKQKMAVVKGKKTEEIVPYDQAVNEKLKIITDRSNDTKTERIIPKGRLYLENDKRERKATGSYYTPDYIVKYIVENTVGPVLKEKFETLAPEFRKAQQSYREAVKRKEAFITQKIKPTDPDLVATREEFLNLVHELFDIKVLDPAMGSGHFLVEAADFISDRLIDFLNGFPWNPVMKMLKDTRTAILTEMEKQGVNIDSHRLNDVNLIKRHVLKRAIYGVDLNPMAVELTKVSLWLNCFTLGAPLSFLDHHLKCGNSLIGASIEDVKKELEKDLFGGQFAGLLQATACMIHVGELSDVTADEVKESQRTFKDASTLLVPFKEVLNLWTSQYFENGGASELFRSSNFPQIGLKWKEEALRIRVSRLLKSEGHKNKTGAGSITISTKEILETSEILHSQKRFFHWELEFPEVFYEKGTKKENGGFDVVVGNPPYDVMEKERLGDTDLYFDLIAYLSSSNVLKTAAGGKQNLFRVFLLIASTYSSKRGRFGFIIPLALLSDNSCVSTLEAICDGNRNIEVHAFPQKDDYKDRVFEDAKLSTCIFIASGIGYEGTFVISSYKGRYFESLEKRYQTSYSELKVFGGGQITIPLVSEAEWRLMRRIQSFDPQSDLGVRAKVTRGEINQTIFREYISWEQSNDEMLKGSEIGFYEEHQPKQGEKEWFDNKKYKLDNNDLKIPPKFRLAIQRISGTDDSRRITGTFVDRSAHFADSLNSISGSDRTDLFFFLSLLNSLLINWRFRTTSTNNNVSTTELLQLPMRHIHFVTSKKERNELVTRGIQIYKNAIKSTRPKFTDLVSYVDFLLPKDAQNNFLAFKPSATGTEEKSDVVHDLLAFLAEEMIRLNNEKQLEMKRFLDWLEKELKIVSSKEGVKGLQVLTGRTRLLNCVGDYQKQERPLSYDELEDILFKNKSRLGISVSNPAFTSKLRVEFERSLNSLLPIRTTLEQTDLLIDRIVYLLYGLTQEEISIVEGKPRQKEEGKTALTFKSNEGSSFSIARESDPRLFAEVLNEINKAGTTTSKQLSDAITSRIRPIGLTYESDKAITVERELEKLGWIKIQQNQILLTEIGNDIVNSKNGLDPFVLARRIATANEKNNAQVVSKLLSRLWEINPEQQGAVIIPQLGKDELPKSLVDFRRYLLNIAPKWIEGLAKTISGLHLQFEAEDLVKKVIDGLKKNWEKQSTSIRFNRSQELIAQYFIDAMFGYIISPSDIVIWQRRLEWAGLTYLAEEIPGMAGYVWFPVGAFRENATTEFFPIPEIMNRGQAFHVHELGKNGESDFGRTLYEAYIQQQQLEGVEYVSLIAVRDWVCYRIKISALTFELMLQDLFPKAVRGDSIYSMALEVDVTPAERNRYKYKIPIVVDEIPRYIISMRNKQL